MDLNDAIRVGQEFLDSFKTGNWGSRPYLKPRLKREDRALIRQRMMHTPFAIAEITDISIVRSGAYAHLVVTGRTPEGEAFSWAITVLCTCPDEILVRPLDPEYLRRRREQIERQVGFFRHLLEDDERVAEELLEQEIE